MGSGVTEQRKEEHHREMQWDASGPAGLAAPPHTDCWLLLTPVLV